MERLDVIEQVTMCTGCKLVDGCRGPVSMTGKPGGIVAVGEAPGGEEDKQGRPFVGPAGKWLRTRLSEVGFDPDEFAYMNVVSCFPHGTPEPTHIAACAPNRIIQLDYLDPQWVLLVGGVALSAYLPDLKVSQVHGRPIMIEGRVNFSCFHPSAAMRRTSYDRDLRADLAKFRKMVTGNPKDWHKFVPDECTSRDCGNLAVWWDPHALGWCEKHMPEEGQERMRLVDNEYRKLSGKPLVTKIESGVITDPSGRRWRTKCTCGLHPHAGHAASPLP